MTTVYQNNYAKLCKTNSRLKPHVRYKRPKINFTQQKVQLNIETRDFSCFQNEQISEMTKNY